MPYLVDMDERQHRHYESKKVAEEPKGASQVLDPFEDF
jgi:hypothetical protein